MVEFLQRMLGGDVLGIEPNLVTCLKPRNWKVAVGGMALILFNGLLKLILEILVEFLQGSGAQGVEPVVSSHFLSTL